MRRSVLGILYAAMAVAGCATAGCVPARKMVDAMMHDAYRAPPAAAIALAGDEPRKFHVLAGDLHTHVAPPDATWDVSRGPEETVELAHDEKLDFVVLTPHVPERFYTREDQRAWAVAGRKKLEEELAKLGDGRTVFIAGMEYTDHHYGHAGVAFFDLAKVLDEVPVKLARERPEAFFERVIEDGGIITLNHPLITPLDSVFSIARADLSFRPFTSTGPFPPEIDALAKLAQTIEVYNLSASALRDRILLGDSEHSIHATLALADREAKDHGHRMAPAGGADTHGHYMRATTFVLATEKTEAAIRDAIVHGRVCVRSPEACSFQARAPNGPWIDVGGDISAGDEIEVRARGGDARVVVDSTIVGRVAKGGVLSVRVPNNVCSVVRAEVGEGYSGSIYVNCGPSR